MSPWQRSRKNRSTLESLEQRIVLTTFTPTHGIADGAANSLRDVISQANSNGQDDVIILGPGNWALDRGNDEATGQDNENLSGDYDLTEAGHSITFIGAGADSTFIDSVGFDRAFQVFAEVRAIFRNLTIRNGQAMDTGFEGLLPGQVPSYGGAILVHEGDIELDGVHITGNVARGADGKPEFDGLRAQGGAIAIFEGTATIRNSVFNGNRARGGAGGEGPNGRHGSADGGGADGENGQDGGAGGNAIGGGIYADESDVFIENTSFSFNRAEGGPGGRGGNGGNGGEGGGGGRGGNGGQGGFVQGGGVYLDTGTLTITDSVFEHNEIRGGLGGVGAPAGDTGPTGGGGDGLNGTIGGSSNIGGWAQGGALAVSFGVVTIDTTSILDNKAEGGEGTQGGLGGRGGFSGGGTGGAGGAGGHAGEGGFAQGGGLYVLRGDVDVIDSTIARNETVGAVGGVGGPGGRAGESSGGDAMGGAAGRGGRGGDGGESQGAGVYSLNVDMKLTNSTISSNLARSGNGGEGGDEGTPAGAGARGTPGSPGRDAASTGGGLWTDDATNALIQSVTIAGNSAVDGDGSGVFNDGSTDVELNSVIVAGNLNDDDYVGRIAFGSSNNVIGNGSGVVGIGNGSEGNVIGTAATPVDAMLGALQNNGGTTLTHALHEGSAAIDAGLRSAAPEFDQRGVLRPLQSSVDAGAFEAQRRLIVQLPDGGGDYRLERDDDEIVIARDFIGGEEIFRYEFTALFSVTLVSSDDADRLIADISSGLPLPPGGVLLQSTPGDDDSIEIVGPSSTELTYELGVAGTGSAIIGGSPLKWENVLSVTDRTAAATRTVQFGETDDTATLTAGSDAGTSRVVHGAATVTMVNPSTALVVNGGGGNDTLSVGTLDAALTASVTIDGQAGNDVVNAVDGSRRLILLGSDGADTLRGTVHNDTIRGGAGNDRLFGRNGADEIHGEDGNDFISGDGGNDVATGGAGDDKVTGGAGRDELSGDGGDDTVLGQGGSGDWISGGDGNDVLNGGRGTDVLAESGNVDFRLTHNRLFGRGTDRTFLIERAHLTGGEADNRLDIRRFNGQSATLDGGAGNDVLLGSPGRDLLRGGDGDDVASGNDGADILFGGEGSDILNGGNGNDVLRGFDGNDILNGGLGLDNLFGGGGNDRLSGGGDNDVLNGEEGDDALSGDLGDDVLNGGLGNDRADGGDGADVINGGDGDDLGTGGAGNDVLNGDAGHDRLFGDDGFDQISGGDGADDLHGGSNADTIEGGAGSDWLFGDGGPDVLRGGTGDDGLSGDADNDRLEGDEGADSLLGGGGNDVLNGGVGTDLLLGQDGDDQLHGNDILVDTLSGGGGANTLNNPDGNDVIDETVSVVARFNPTNGQLTVLLEADRSYVLSGLLGPLDLKVDGADAPDVAGVNAADVRRVLIQGSTGNDSVDLMNVAPESFPSLVADGVIIKGGAGDDVLTGSEFSDSILGGAGNDVIHGLQSPDTLRGGIGNDTIHGGRGEDVIFGDAGDDSLNGGDNADRLDGGTGHDILRGLSGNDTLSGGAGNDSLAGTRGDDLLNGGTGADILLGGDDMDTLQGGNGDDSLQGGYGADLVKGEAGADVVAAGAGIGEEDSGDIIDGPASEIDEFFQFEAGWTENS